MSGLGKCGERVQEGSLYALLLLLPFSKAAIEILFGCLLVGWIVRELDPARRGDRLWTDPRVWLLLLFLGGYLMIGALSIAISDYPSLSLRGLVSKWLEYLVLCLIMVDLGRRPTVVRRSVSILAWTSLAVIVEALTQELFGKGLARGYPLVVYGRMTGPYENPIDLGTYFVVVIPLLLTSAVVRRGMRAGLLWGILALATVCLARTIATGAWLALGIALVVLVASNAALRRASAIVLGVTIVVGGFSLHKREDLTRIVSLSDLGTVDRWAMWQAAMGMIRDRPLLGHGLNTFMANYLDYWVGGQRQPRYAHNCYLQVWAETGLLGLVAFLGILGAMVALWVASVRRMRDGPERLMFFGLMAGLIAFLVQSAYDTNFYALRQAALFWTLAGLTTGYAAKTLAMRVDAGENA